MTHTPIIWCDNAGAISLASNPIFHALTKPIEVDYHYIRKKVLRKELIIRFISTVDQLTNIFTKGLSSAHFHVLKSKFMVRTSPVCFGGILAYPMIQSQPCWIQLIPNKLVDPVNLVSNKILSSRILMCIISTSCHLSAICIIQHFLPLVSNQIISCWILICIIQHLLPSTKILKILCFRIFICMKHSLYLYIVTFVIEIKR